MAIGIVTRECFEKEVIAHNAERIISDVKVKHISLVRGRGIGNTETPAVVRDIIADRSISGESANSIASDTGISQSSISAYKNGATSTATYHKPDEQLVKNNRQVEESIRDRASSKLLDAIDSITKDDLLSTKVRDRAGVASAMSSVIRNIGPQVDKATNIQVNVFRPRQREEDEYEILTVNE